MTPILCKRCGGRCAVRWQEFVNHTRHIRAYCPQCREFAGYVPQTPEAVALADAAAEEERRADVGLFDGVTEAGA